MYSTAKVCIHVTSAEAIQAITQSGLKPMLGPLSSQIETQPAIFMFPSWESLEDANWLFDEWPYESEPALLAVDTTGLVLESPQPYEVVVRKPIPPSRIKVLAPGEENWNEAKRKFIEMGGLNNPGDTPAIEPLETNEHGKPIRAENGLTAVLFHGTSAKEENSIRSKNRFSSWASVSKELAQQYAEMRAMDGSEEKIIAMGIRSKEIFDANKLPETLTVRDFIREVHLQAKRIPTVDLDQAQRRLGILAKQEESGPHYSRHNFWHEPDTFFGQDGAAIIKETLLSCGFNTITMIEQGVQTYGALNFEQIELIECTQKQIKRAPKREASKLGM